MESLAAIVVLVASFLMDSLAKHRQVKQTMLLETAAMDTLAKLETTVADLGKLQKLAQAQLADHEERIHVLESPHIDWVILPEADQA